MTPFLTAILTLGLAFTPVYAGLLQCVKNTTCSCVTNSGAMINLKPLDKSPNPSFTASSGDITYSWNPCTDVTVGTVTAGCIQDTGGIDYDCGSNSISDFQMDGGDVVFVMISSGGYGLRTAYVKLQCTDGASFTFDKEDPINNYHFTLKSSACCPKTPGSGGSSGGLSVGSVLLIIFVTVLLMYLVVGAVVQVAVRKKEGRERVPNVVFWAALPGLIKDGCIFTFSCGKRAATYDSI